ncbi:MAG: LytR C-terminal domain-containing protein [Candidatus Levybacteria bacterium]|nr:LytR C-terminal domain-containing protein [Candidatus Levybacteria bacterium]
MKKKESRLRNTKIAIIFFVLLAFFVGLSLIFKIVLVVRAGQFDESRRFNLAVSNNKSTEIMSLSGSSKAIAVFKLNRNIGSREAGRLLEIPIDGFIESSSLDLSQKPDSLFLASILNAGTLQTNLTIIDLLKFLLLSKSIPGSAITTKDIAPDLNPLESDKIVGQLVSDELIEKDNQTIQVINGTQVGGLGNRLARLLTNIGGDVIIVATENNQRKQSIILYIDKKTYTVERLQKILGYPAVKEEKNAISDITIIIGEDKVSSGPF